VRHPQYTGLFIALFGKGVVHWATLFSVALFPVIVLIYVWLAYREKQQVIARFGDTYREYQGQVPMFIPRWGQWRKPWSKRQLSDGIRIHRVECAALAVISTPTTEGPTHNRVGV